jgi:hypothetical protein
LEGITDHYMLLSYKHGGYAFNTPVILFKFNDNKIVFMWCWLEAWAGLRSKEDILRYVSMYPNFTRHRYYLQGQPFDCQQVLWKNILKETGLFFGRTGQFPIFALPKTSRVRLRARTPPFHGGDTGSNPVRGTKVSTLAKLKKLF